MSKQYKYLKVGLASPEEILSWSHGEVTKHETINYRTLKPDVDGLFCEKIFGPTKDYQCACGKSKRNTDKGKICEKCGVEITESRVRRERMGHIQLASPVVHAWFLRNTPSPLATLLDIKSKDLEQIVYLASYIVINPGNVKELKEKDILSEQQYSEYQDKYPKQFEAKTGAEAIEILLKNIDLEAEAKELRRRLKTKSKQKLDKTIKRLDIVESFLRSDNRPEWMILKILPVIPPDLRPMVQLEGGRFATTDLNDLYRRILNRNNRLKKQYEQNAPSLIIKNEKRMLQEAVDALIDNSKRGRRAATERNHSLKSLSDMLRGKQGRFRQNLLGKRVDYSGRSVIVVGPNLKMYQCGLPKEMALTLFKPFVIRELMKRTGVGLSVASKQCDNQEDIVWGILEEVIREHPVLLNRAPTLHRLGIQAFEPVLIEGKAIRLHPLVCTPFNADFDGDQMAVHVPLSIEAQAESRLLMLACNNILNPRDGKPVVTPSQDMILGNYYLTLEEKGLPNEGHFFKDYDEAYTAYKNGYITLHTRIFVDISYLPTTRFMNGDKPLDLPSNYLFTTMGKMIFNNIIPNEFPYLNDNSSENLNGATPLKYFLDSKGRNNNTYEELIARDLVEPMKKPNISAIIAAVFKKLHITETSKMLDRIKDLGYKYSTIAGFTISAADVLDYKGKNEMVAEADAKVAEIQEEYECGLLTNKERKKLVEDVWRTTRKDIEDGVWEAFKASNNHIYMMADSGSRGSRSNFSQLAGMRGLMANTAGETIEVPVKANFREGLSVAEFFISTHGSRKGSTDTALKTAESGYLTRRLVDVSQSVVICEEDDGSDKGMYYENIYDEAGKLVVSLKERCIGRFAAKDVINPETGEVIVKRNEFIDEEKGAQIEKAGVTRVCLRTALTCNSETGISMMSYGRNLATNMIVEVGEAVGTIAAQSIGEPGTQLTMRTFHTGGVASAADITQGLPRVQELFEARKPKGLATISEIDGEVVSKENTKAGVLITIKNDTEKKEYTVDATAEILVAEGDRVARGQKLIRGSLHPKELLRVLNAEAAQKYIIEEVQKVYRSQSVNISDKHIEIIVRQMMRKINVVTEGESNLLPGKDVTLAEFKEAVKDSLRNGKKLPVGKAVLLGITKAALAADSFLSAASFQETTRVLTSAAIQSKVDYLQGIKENVTIGGLIPAGTGILQEESFECEHRPEEEIEEDDVEELNQNEVEEDDEDEDYEDESEGSIITEDELNDTLAD